MMIMSTLIIESEKSDPINSGSVLMIVLKKTHVKNVIDVQRNVLVTEKRMLIKTDEIAINCEHKW